jgi:hypothetical protein
MSVRCVYSQGRDRPPSVDPAATPNSVRVLHDPVRNPPPAIPRMFVPSDASALVLGLETMREATPDERQELIAKMCRRHPGITEAEALTRVHALSSSDRVMMLADQHPEYQSGYVFGGAKQRAEFQGGEEAQSSLADNSDNWGSLGRSIG